MNIDLYLCLFVVIALFVSCLFMCFCEKLKKGHDKRKQLKIQKEEQKRKEIEQNDILSSRNLKDTVIIY